MWQKGHLANMVPITKEKYKYFGWVSTDNFMLQYYPFYLLLYLHFSLYKFFCELTLTTANIFLVN